MAKVLFNNCHQRGTLQGVSAKLEEIIVDGDSFAFEDAGKQSGHNFGRFGQVFCPQQFGNLRH